MSASNDVAALEKILQLSFDAPSKTSHKMVKEICVQVREKVRESQNVCLFARACTRIHNSLFTSCRLHHLLALVEN